MRELDLLTVFQILLRKIKWLLAAAIVGAVLGLVNGLRIIHQRRFHGCNSDVFG